MRRVLPATVASLAGFLLLLVPHGRSIEQLFVAQMQAASARDW